MSIVVRGKVWKFGDNVNTDVMAPGYAFDWPWDKLKKEILHIHPKFTKEVKSGDVIVAGKNWGCGSSRETAPGNLKKLGLGCVVAESFARIYFRNGIALGFPGIVCHNISKSFDEGDELELDLESASVRNLTKGKELQGEVLTKDMLDIVTKGGIMAALQERMGTKKKEL